MNPLHEWNSQDPSGVSVTSRVFFDFRDLRRDGFLLSLTVLPSVLHEAVSSVASTSDSEPVLASSAFRFRLFLSLT